MIDHSKKAKLNPVTPATTSADGPSTGVMIKNLPWSATVENLKEFFGSCGTITYVLFFLLFT